MAKPLKKTNNIVDAEWRFDRVPKDELEVCLLYEFGRESQVFREKVAAWREKRPKVMEAAEALLNGAAASTGRVRDQIDSLRDGSWRTKVKGVDAEVAGGTQGADNSLAEWLRLPIEERDAFAGMDAMNGKWFLYVFPPFPRFRWLEIPSEGVRKNAFDLFMFQNFDARANLAQWIWTLGREYSMEISREKSIQATSSPMPDSQVEEMVRASAAKHIFAPGIVEANGARAWPSCAQWDQSFERVWVDEIIHQEVKFIVNWGCSDKTIQKGFAAWLKRQRPRPALKIQNVAQAQEYLRQLGALRLTKQLTLREATSLIVEADASGGETALYSSESAVSAASEKASKVLKRMFPDG